MKRFFCIFVIAIFFSVLNCFAQNFDLKNYSDYSKDFKGSASAIFIGNINDEETEKKLEIFMELFPEDTTTFTKLTKNNMWLCKQALNEWEYEKDECYIVICTDNKWAKEGILLIVKIKGKDDFDWFGISITEKLAEQLSNTTED